MKRLIIYLAAILLAILPPQGASSQAVTTMGTDFWLGFMDNVDPALGGDMLKVLVSGPRACNVTLTNPNTGWSATANVSPGVVAIIPVPLIQGYSSLSCTVMNRGLHLTSSDSVSVYASICGNWNYEVSNIYPTGILRDEYMIVSYPSDRHGSCFNIIATEDSTWVDIHLSNTTDHGHAAGSTLSVLLPVAGNSYQVISPAIGDFSGTTVKSRDCKRIAVYHGDRCVYIPDLSTGQSCDHAEEQAVPVAYWGQNYIVTTSQSSLPDRVRITALRDSCHVYRNGTLMGTIQAGQTMMYNVSGNTPAAYIHTSQPSSVNVFFASTNAGTGDPSMVTITPLEQMLKQITFASFNTQYTNIHYINIVTKTADVNNITLDGVSIANNFTLCQFNTDYSYAKKQVSAGSHTLASNGGDGFTAYAFGMGSHESYAYSVGSCMRDLDKRITVNDLNDASLNDTVRICAGDEVRCYLTTQAQYNQAVWYYGDGTNSSGDTVTHTYPTAGYYLLTCIVDSDSSDCFPSDDTLQTHVLVYAVDTLTIDTMLCRRVLAFMGEHIIESGSYYFDDNTMCGKIRLNVTFLDPVDSYHTETGCDSVLFSGLYFYNGDTTIVTYTASNGCDSLEHIIFKTYPAYNFVDVIHIFEGDSLLWRDGNTYYEATNLPSVHYYSSHGCDSVYQLNLLIDERPHVDSSAIWVPNVFTPDENSNAVFQVFSYDMEYVHVYIFSRWGDQLAEFDGLTEYWDGTYRGYACPQRAYVYMIEYITKDKPNYKNKKVGTVLLLR